MKKSLLFSLFLMFAVAIQAWAQQGKTVTGKVTDQESGQALPGVAVMVKGTTVGTATGADGGYTINVPANGNTLVFRYIGYESKEVAIGSAANVNVSLELDTKQLSEVVVTGYGEQERREVTGSISSVKAEEIEDLPIQTFDKALQGRAAGVQVTSQGGQPGGGVTVNIRGTATINGSSQPLYIIDGVQVSPGGLSGQTSANVLSSINPADIESIEILKDAAAASIYGSQAANGVVIVTTKRGKAGKTKIKASVQYGVSEAYNPYDVLSGPEWYMLRQEAVGNWYARTGRGTFEQGKALAAVLYFDGDAPEEIPSYNWVEAVMQQGNTQQYDLSLSGGDAKTSFYVSGSFNKTEGTVLQSKYTRGTFRTNLDHKVTDKLTISSTIGLTGSESTGPSTNAGFYSNGAFTGGLFTSPINPIYNEDGTYNEALYGTSLNIVQNIMREDRVGAIFQTVSNFSASYDIIPGLRAKVLAGIDLSDVRDRNYRPADIPVGKGAQGQANETYRRNINWTSNATLNYNKKLNKVHNIGALVGFEYRSVTNTSVSASTSGFASPLLKLPGSGATPSSTNSAWTAYKTTGFFGNFKYDYNDKYLGSVTLRYDGSSRFGADVRYGLFYGLSGGWRISEESFMQGAGFLDDLKLRASYGVVGSQPTNNFGSLGLYGGGGAYDGAPSVRPTQLANPNLTWEESAMLNLGLDFGVFNNRIFGSVDVYKKNNTNLLLYRDLPVDSGFGSILENGGEVEARGLDFEITTVNIDKGDFRWSTNFNIGFVENELISLNVGDKIGTEYEVGKPLNLIQTVAWAGVNPADGRPMWYDANGNITYSPSSAADRKIIGDQNADFFGGAGTNIAYKGLSLDVLFQYQYGNSSFLQAGQILEAAGSWDDNQVRSQLDRWTTPGQITWVPRPYYNELEPGGAYHSGFSSRYVEEASYIRLKQMTLNYRIPGAISSKFNLGSASVYVQAMNLATFTNYRGDDPENTGQNLNAYPNPRMITGGINLEF